MPIADVGFYTYIYQRHDGTPYYIGKGTGNRAFQSWGHNIHVPERARILIEHWGSEERAFEMERWYIQLFGRKDKGTGILRNMTDGGDGSTGWVPTEENKANISRGLRGRLLTAKHRQSIAEGVYRAFATTDAIAKMTVARQGRKPMLGKKHSEETRKKMSIARQGRKPMLGKKHSEETRRRMSEAHRKRIQ